MLYTIYIIVVSFNSKPKIMPKNKENKSRMENKRAPAFCLKNQDGEKRCLKDLLAELKDDGFLLLYFYPRDNTSGCTREAVNLSENKRKLSARGVKVVGISKLSFESKKKFQERHNLKIELLADEDCKVSEKYGVFKEKTMYGKKIKGISRESFLISKYGKILKHFAKVTPDKHAEEVLEAIKALKQ